MSNKKGIKKIFKAKNIIPFLIIFFVSIFSQINASGGGYELSLLNFDNYILAEIKGSGNQKIFFQNENPAETDPGHFTTFPDNIIINGNPYTSTIGYTINFPSDENQVKFEWNTQINSMRNMFRNAKNIVKLDFTHFDFSLVTNMESLCNECSSLESVDLKNIEALKVTSMLFLFNNCKSLISVDFSNFKTRDILSIKAIFFGCEKLVSVDLSSFDTPNLQDTSDAFNGCLILKYLSINNLITSEVIHMQFMFGNCKALESINIGNFDTKKVEYMEGMFYQCSKLLSLDLHNFYTPSLINMHAMFYNCSKMETLDISNFNTTNVINMAQVFDQCHSIKSLDLSHFYTPKMTSMYHMFFNCQKLQFLDISNFNTDKIDNMIDLFYNCNSLTSLNLSNFNTSLVNSTEKMFHSCYNLEIVDLSSFDTRNVESMHEMFFNCYKLKSLDLKHFYTPKLKTMYSMFYQCTVLTSLDITNFDTSNVNRMSHVFAGCKYLTSLDIRNFDTEKVNNMDNMFSNCQNLTSLDITRFKTEKVTNMKQMFDQCNKLTSLNLSNFYTPLLTEMYNIFYNCYSLVYLDVSHFQTSKVTNMQSIFRNNRVLTTLDLSSFDTSLVTNMESMFHDCKALTTLDLSNFYTPKLINGKNMFAYCDILASLDLSNFNTSVSTDISGMFAKCVKLTTLDLSTFDTSSVTNFNSLFDNCKVLTTLDISHFNTSKATSMNRMFDQCNSLLSLNLSNFDTSHVTSIDNIFFACHALKSLDISNFDTKQITSFETIFRYTYALTSLNLSSFDIYFNLSVNNILNPTYNNITLCYNESRVSEAFILQVASFPNSCIKLCKTHLKKYILATEMCIDNCYSETVYKYEYDDICYDECPPRTQLKLDSTYLCEDCRNYYDYGGTGCLETVPIGYYNNDTSAKTIDKCPDKCATCSLNSIKDNKNLCTSCKNGNNYYYKIDDPKNVDSFYECYHKDEVVTEYYLDTRSNNFKRCYEKCNKCDGAGTNTNNHCTECINDDNIYDIIDNNCICRYFNNYEQTGCINTNIIPNGFYNNDTLAKTIDKCPDKCATCSLNSIKDNKKLCTSCKNDNNYYYKIDDPKNVDSFYECYHKDEVVTEYYLDTVNNIFKRCYEKCNKCDAAGTITDNHCTECINDGNIYDLINGNCICHYHYNYEQTECINTDIIPNGYYNNDTTARTIDKCPDKCATCSFDSIKDNKNLCTSCKTGDDYYYKIDDPKNVDSFYECYHKDEVVTEYYLDTNIFKRCYGKCNKCDGAGTNTDNHCTECINDGNIYDLIDKNCICHYFNNYEQTGCINTNTIPNGFYNNDTLAKTIDKCPDKCATCSFDSIKDNKKLCTSCKNDNNYYYKIDDPRNVDSFYECYHKDEVVTEYYLDTNIYKPCFSRCNKCSEGGDDTNNNCLECINNKYDLKDNNNCICKGYFNIDKTDCTDSVPNGYYNNDPITKTIEHCPNKCATCSYDSIITNNNLCQTCNTNYYQKENDPNNKNTFIGCYQGEQEGYYFDTNIYKPCYEKCKTCEEGGNDANNNCIECIDNSLYELHDGNCKLVCENYFNIDKTACIDTIPEGFYNNDLITKTIEQCPDKCAACSYNSIVTNNNLCQTCKTNYYQKENDPNNKNTFIDCYQGVQEGYYFDTNIFKPCYEKCKLCDGEGNDANNHCLQCINNKYDLIEKNCICHNYYNYEHTDCTDTIPIGFYNNDTSAKTIDKCPDKCATCSLDSIKDNKNLCTSCKNDNHYYYKIDDPKNVDSFYECYHKDEVVTEYYLDNNIFKRCYEKCNKCDGAGTITDNHCTECINNSFQLIGGNCICPNYYNLDKTDCLNTIPDGFYNNDTSAKTIDKCPDKCATCSYDSIVTNNNLCQTCNTIDNYYQKENDPNNKNSFIECYSKDEEQEGYYFDTNIFKPCYEKCKICEEGGNDENNNCLECIDDNNYELTGGNCIYSEKDEFKYSYEVKSVSEEIKNDYTHTFIDMNEETISHLKEVFSLGQGSKIFVHIVENEDSNIATTNYTYEYILENGTKLDLDDIKEDVYVDVYVPLKDLDAVNFDLAKKYAELGYDIYNLNSKFYTDFCTPVSLNGNDVPLAERKKEIYPNNITLCKDNCIYKGINLEQQRVICQCNLNNNITNNNENLVQENENFVAYLLDKINYKLFLCYKLFFNINYIKKSYAFFIIITIFILALIIDFIFLSHSLGKIKNFMLKETSSYKKLYKEVYIETKRTDDDIDNISNEKNANPLKKELGKNKDKRIKKKKKSDILKNKAKSEKILLYDLMNKKIDNGNDNENIQTEEPFKIDIIDEKKQKSEKKKRKKSKFSKKNLQDKKEVMTEICTKKELKENARKYEDNEKYKEGDINELPYSKAIELDKRNIFHIYYSFLIEKLEIISIFCTSNRFKIILFVEYILALLINFFFNALLYSDDVVSQKYHNNGHLDLVVSLALSIISNLVTSIFCYYIKYSRGIDERLDLILEIKRNMHYYRNMQKFLEYLKKKFICFFLLQLIIFATCIYYIEIFCVKYYCSQKSLVINYCYSFIESIITSFAIALIILITRKIGLSCFNKEFYNASKFINSKT